MADDEPKLLLVIFKDKDGNLGASYGENDNPYELVGFMDALTSEFKEKLKVEIKNE